VRAVARGYAQRANAFFIGAPTAIGVARGAQKLKEIAYLHAEAYPASELSTGRWRSSAGDADRRRTAARSITSRCPPSRRCGRGAGR
jgi:hypothetical protein